MPTKKPLLTLNMEPELIRRVDEFRFRYWFPSRTAAIKWLLEAALEKGVHPTQVAEDQREG